MLSANNEKNNTTNTTYYERLVVAARTKGAAAITKLQEELQEQIQAAAYSSIGNYSIENDELMAIAMEEFIELIQYVAPDNYDNFKGYIYAALRNRIRNRLKKEFNYSSRNIATDFQDEEARSQVLGEREGSTDLSPEEYIEKKIYNEELKRALNSLPYPDKDIILARYCKGLAPATVQASLGCSRSQLYNLQNRALAKLREMLKRLK